MSDTIPVAAPSTDNAGGQDELDHGETVLRIQEQLGITRTGWVSPDAILLRIRQLQGRPTASDEQKGGA